MPIRVLLADDHEVVRQGIRAMLNEAADVEIVGEAADGAEVERLVAELQPDVVLLDLVMPGLRPVEFVRWVQERYLGTKVLPLTAHDRECYLAWMMEVGAVGFLAKSEPLEGLAERIRCAAQGEGLFDEEQRKRAGRWREEVYARWEGLTVREREVLHLLAEGKDNQAIAQALGVQLRTVEQHITNILNKLGLSSRLEAAVWMRDHMPPAISASNRVSMRNVKYTLLMEDNIAQGPIRTR